MKAKTTRLHPKGAFDDHDDPALIARGLAYGISIGVVLWALAAAGIVWLI